MDTTDFLFTVHLFMDKARSVALDIPSGVFMVVDQISTAHAFIWNSISKAFFSVAADMLVQILHDRQHDLENWIYDKKRTGRMFTSGLLTGGFGHLWYQNLDALFPTNQLGHVMVKVLADQTMASGFFITIYIFTNGILEGLTFRGVYDEWRLSFIDIYKCDWLFWPAAQFINFLIMPNNLRILYVNIASFVWNIFLSYTTQKTKRKKKDLKPWIAASVPETDYPLVSSRSCILSRRDSLHQLKHVTRITYPRGSVSE